MPKRESSESSDLFSKSPSIQLPIVVQKSSKKNSFNSSNLLIVPQDNMKREELEKQKQHQVQQQQQQQQHEEELESYVISSNNNNNDDDDLLNSSSEFTDSDSDDLSYDKRFLIKKLKEQNNELTTIVSKQKFKFTGSGSGSNKTTTPNPTTSNPTQKQTVEALRKELQNAHKQIEFYKEKMFILKSKNSPMEHLEKEEELKSNIKRNDEHIQELQSELKTKKAIYAQQQKELRKILGNNIKQDVEVSSLAVMNKESIQSQQDTKNNNNNNNINNSQQQQEQSSTIYSSIDKEIELCKKELKEIKATLSKRETIEKRQHFYLAEIEKLIRTHRKELETKEKLGGDVINNDDYDENLKSSHQQKQQQELVDKSEIDEAKIKFLELKKRYEENSKRMTYLNYMKSKENKEYEVTELKYKQRLRTYEKLCTKLNEVNKLNRFRPSINIEEIQNVSVNMARLQDILSKQGGPVTDRENRLEDTNSRRNIQRIKQHRSHSRNYHHHHQSEHVREFKKWEIEGLNQMDNVND